MSTPLVSVVIPSYNCEQYVGAAIDSVLSQGEPNIEVIVVDDGSTDGTSAVIAATAGVTLIRQENQGAGAARNRGLAEASGTYLGLLDADDLWAPGKLAAQLDVFRSDPTVDLVYANIEEFVSEDMMAEERSSLVARTGVLAASLPSTVLMTRRAVAAIGEFLDGTGAGEALDWALRVTESGLRTAVADDALVYRRIHANNTGRTQRASQRKDYLEALKRSLDRRRAEVEKR